MHLALVFLASLSVYVTCQNDNDVRLAMSDDDFEAMMINEVPEQIRYFGYPTETHEVVTDDGYNLTIIRVPSGKGQPFDNRRPIVLFSHGVFCHSAEFFITGPGNSLGFIFADAGFDVWVLNGRGTRYSRKHASLDPDRDRAFWSYSFHEVALYDLAKVIDYVLELRNAETLVHVGKSDGTTTYYALMSMKPEYNKKVSVHYSLAPVAYFRHLRSLFVAAAVFNYDTLTSLVEQWKIYEVTRDSWFFDFFAKFCYGDSEMFLCKIAMFAIAGFNYKHFDDRMMSLILTNSPMSTSYQQLIHHFQNAKTGEFRQFDYGLAKNMQLYNSSEPPVYDLSLISSRVRLVYSCNDMLSSCEDVDYLYRRLPNAKKIEVELASWNHFDFEFATEIKTYLADPILEDLKNFVKF